MKQALATEKPSRSSFQYTYAQKGKDRSHSSVTVSAWTTDPRQLVLGRVLFIFKLVFSWCCKIFTPPSALAPEWTILQSKRNHVILWLKPFNAFLLSPFRENMTIYMNYHKPSVTLGKEKGAAKEENEIMTLAEKWKELEDSMISEISQTQKDK